MDGVGVELDVLDEETGVLELFIREDSFKVDFLEGGCDGVFDVLKILDTLRVINNYVGATVALSAAAVCVRGLAIVPDSGGLVLVPSEFGHIGLYCLFDIKV